MANKSNDSAEGEKGAAPTKKKKGKLIIIITIVVAVAAGAAGSFFYFQSAAAKSKAQKSKSADDDQAHDEDGHQGEESGEDEKEGKDKAKSTETGLVLPKDGKVKSVVEIQPFILNLADKEENRFLRLSLSLGFGEEGEEKPDQVFLTRVRNAVLAVLMTKTSVDVLSAEGKAALRKELLGAIRTAAKEPRVEALYITELIVQR